MEAALEIGYRHIDTAAAYGNEQGVGQAIRNALAKGTAARPDIFVTTKLMAETKGYEAAHRAFNASLDALGLDYVDLYLIHWPASPFFHDNWKTQNADTWRAFEKLYREGRIRAIGVSNFMPRHIEELLKTAEIAPMVDQIEFHPGWMQKDCTELK